MKIKLEDKIIERSFSVRERSYYSGNTNEYWWHDLVGRSIKFYRVPGTRFGYFDLPLLQKNIGIEVFALVVLGFVLLSSLLYEQYGVNLVVFLVAAFFGEAT